MVGRILDITSCPSEFSQTQLFAQIMNPRHRALFARSRFLSQMNTMNT